MSVDNSELEEAYAEALRLEKDGQREAAANAWRTVLALDPTDHCGAAIRLAALGAEAAPAKAPDAYIETLFGQVAYEFDHILVDQLRYDVPNALRAQLLAQGLGPFARGLDLGCGTGLTGESLDGMVETFIGIDIAEPMIEMADERDVYDGLYVAEAEDFLLNIGDEEESFDFIVATDVLPYLGAVETLFGAAAAKCRDGAIFAFSTELLAAGEGTAPAGGPGYRVNAHQRYAHDPAYLLAALNQAGFDLIAADPVMVRLEKGEPIAGQLILSRKMTS